jgi:TatD DNase family protein
MTNTYAFFDIHSHLHDKAFDDAKKNESKKSREQILAEMKSIGVGTITVGTGLKESRDAIALADAHPHIYATVGLHPCDNVLESYNADAFGKLASHSKVVAIGECGLDYHYIETFFERDVTEKELHWNKDAEKERQKIIFSKQIELAVQVDKPLMLHGRPSKGSMDAYEDMLNILESAKEKYGERLRGNAHFFVGNIDIAERFINLNFTMSFSGVITFAHDYDNVLRFIPLEMIHAETDSPYATPAPFRGQRNDPRMVQEIVARISVLRQEPLEEVRVQLLENAKRVFGIYMRS